ncbi:NADP-dependent 3-hydroxy acid dehydrogenase YdfG [Microbacteriaceae bacterium SG_E_30_P1]|uniref:NADP-dependent 3-hydroxy acid dehydrogenase YdfG n=1 Tax=Antiquaquibacter oligotrophicus TaxID=2880260 RepID=A0ABT6KSS0_9MICO|nr:SDR family NAD(P)-dependent oxidoreductase [Antiquaquibacter oligotrophicus]MDH6182097.1 NADP-dependent 3-hydroxy acid dehydrogenase YdfG [Antiquaquibacter oligotrophicus]UDF12238.1 SDR family NAD(P)-dependent oxidoreductase [Antiquaquibacter oligotrophicus]
MTTLDGKVAWVIGGGSGIGAGAARALADAGATVVVSGRRVSELEAVASVGIHAVPADVSDEQSVVDAHARIEADYGVVDIVVYSAGTNVRNRYWADTTPADFARVVDVNLTGAMRVIHAVLPGMRGKSDGLIVVVSSWAGWRFAPGVGAGYSTSKTALGALVETVNAQERLQGIRATHLCPGEVRTEILNTRPVVPTAEEQELMLTSEDLGDAVRYIAELPSRVCINELVITPTSNTSYA